MFSHIVGAARVEPVSPLHNESVAVQLCLGSVNNSQRLACMVQYDLRHPSNSAAALPPPTSSEICSGTFSQSPNFKGSVGACWAARHPTLCAMGGWTSWWAVQPQSFAKRIPRMQKANGRRRAIGIRDCGIQLTLLPVTTRGSASGLPVSPEATPRSDQSLLGPPNSQLLLSRPTPSQPHRCELFPTYTSTCVVKV
jgi:hypothetical protein